jgi:hypothetical protein
VSLQPGFGNVEPQGSRTVSPASTTTYTLVASCSASGGTTSQAVTVTVNPAATIHKQGSLTIQENNYVDLDEGTIGNSDADIWFEVRSANQRFITPQNNAQVAFMSTTQAGYDGCRTASWGGSIRISNLKLNTYVCVRTNQGRYSQFRVTAAAGPSPSSLTIYYITWD